MASGRAGTAARRQAAGVDMDDAAYRRALPRAVQRIQLDTAADLQRLAIRVQNEARRLAPVDTGRLRSSLQHVMGEDSTGPWADVGTNVVYAPHVEYGTSVSPAQPFMRPALLLAAAWWSELAAARR